MARIYCLVLFFIIGVGLVGCASAPVLFGGAITEREYGQDGRLTKVTVARTPSIRSILFGESSPGVGEESIREGVAHRLHGRAIVDESRAGLNDATSAKLATVKTAEEIRALAELRSANTPDEGSVSAYNGGNRRHYGEGASAYIRSVRDRFRY